MKRGYKRTEIESIVNTRKQVPRINTLKYKQKSKGQNPPLVLTTYYNPAIKHLRKAVKKHWHLIENDPEAKLILHRPPMIAYKRHKNLKEYLTSKLK